MVGANSVRLDEFEEQLQAIQEESRRNLQVMWEEMRQSAVETKNAIMEELRSFVSGIMNDKSRGVANGESMTHGAILARGIKGILPTPKDKGTLKPGSSSGSGHTLGAVFGSPLDLESMHNYLPKIELITFDGREPRVWVRKCVKYFEVYKVPSEEKVGIASIINTTDAW